MPIDKKDLVLCRIHGLTSAKGQSLNGLAASFSSSAAPTADGRVGVTMDGVPSTLAIKMSNLQIVLPENDLAAAVGRSDLRATECLATVVDQRRSKRLTMHTLPVDNYAIALRSGGSLKAILEYLKAQTSGGLTGETVFHLTDLNVARLLQFYVVHQEWSKQLESSQQSLARKIGKQLSAKTTGSSMILFKYSPFRIQRGDRPAAKRLQAVQEAKFFIYPCPCETFLDSLEVRYNVGPGRSTHEFFLDFGESETLQYAENIHAMEEWDRLSPPVVADVDPQMFWSSVLHSKALAKLLEQLNVPTEHATLAKEWSDIYKSYLKAILAFKETVGRPSEAVRLLPGLHGQWNLPNDKIHRTVATRNAKLAILMIIDWIMQDHDEKGIPMNGISIELMDNYKGTEIDEEVSKLYSAMKSKDPLDIQIAMGSIMRWKETLTCDYCGEKPSDMMVCSRCQSASYCNVECQRAAWKAHKKVCKQLKEEMPEKSKVTPMLYDRNTATQDPTPQIFSEASGLGFLRILTCKGVPLVPNILSFKAMKNDTIFKTEVISTGGLNGPTNDLSEMASTMLMDNDGAKTFQEVSDLDPITRLCLSCGPLYDLDLARRSLDEALAQVHGVVSDLKMPFVGFTPLEWAAKKGHADITEWLLSDPRSRPLVHVGSPVGWACYTNRVPLARMLVQHGADANATTEVLFDFRPPILVAAENGMVDAVQYLVEEEGVSIKTTWKGNGILEHVVDMCPNWNDLKGHRAVRKYALKKLKE